MRPADRLVVWYLEGAGRPRVKARGTGVRDAFARLNRRDRADVTLHGVSVRMY